MSILTARRLSFFFLCVPSHNIFLTFFAKSFAVSIIIVTFVAELERTEKNGRVENLNY